MTTILIAPIIKNKTARFICYTGIHIESGLLNAFLANCTYEDDAIGRRFARFYTILRLSTAADMGSQSYALLSVIGM